MKKQLFLIVFLFSTFHSLHSQDWFAADNTWVYRSYQLEYNGYAEASIIGDTTINNIPAKIMNFAHSVGNPLVAGIMNFEGQVIVHEKNDSVFYLNSINDFTLMYDFNMVPGDTMMIFGENKGMSCDDPTVLFLDSLSTLTQGTQSFRVQHMTVIDPVFNDTFPKDIIEFIGDTKGSFILQNNHPCVFDFGELQLCSFQNLD